MDREEIVKKYYSKSQNNNALFYNVETSFYGVSAIYKIQTSQLKTFQLRPQQ
jgi:hypothetical protein